MLSVESLIDSIKVELGYPVISLYITDEMITTLINKAIRKCSHKAIVVKTAECLVENGRIDLTGMNVEAVKSIYMGRDSDTYLNVDDEQIFGNKHHYNHSNMMGAIALANYRSQLDTMTMFDYYQDGDLLYVDDYSGKVMLEYVTNVVGVEDLDSDWSSWVEGYATALCKVVEGRIRGKYKPQNTPFEIESDNLVSEGNQTITELETQLASAMGYFNIMR